jgi:hypothetical protein
MVVVHGGQKIARLKKKVFALEHTQGKLVGDD